LAFGAWLAAFVETADGVWRVNIPVGNFALVDPAGVVVTEESEKSQQQAMALDISRHGVLSAGRRQVGSETYWLVSWYAYESVLDLFHTRVQCQSL
jgi:hypothetical protein